LCPSVTKLKFLKLILGLVVQNVDGEYHEYDDGNPDTQVDDDLIASQLAAMSLADFTYPVPVPPVLGYPMIK
jgi:hypothetical protein